MRRTDTTTTIARQRKQRKRVVRELVSGAKQKKVITRMYVPARQDGLQFQRNEKM